MTQEQELQLRIQAAKRGYKRQQVEAFVDFAKAKEQAASSSTEPPAEEPGFIDRLKQSFEAGTSKVKQGFQQASEPKGPLQGFEAALKIGAGAVEAAFSPITAAAEPVVKPTVGKLVNKVADKISDSPAVQRFATSKAGQVTERVAEDLLDLTTIAGAVVGPKVAPKVGQAVTTATKQAGKLTGKATQPLRRVAQDVIPTTDRVISHQVAQALDLTPGDLKNILLNTGNDVGQFVADNNLIGTNKAATVANLQSFFKTNYDAVRNEIARVKNSYKPYQVPRYVESLKQLKRQVDDVPGLQETSVEIDRLLGKRTDIVLPDVQRVKELMDDYFDLYKVTGNVGEGVAKEGLVNIRKDLQIFIEQEVKKSTGKDIRGMNNNVSTARSTLIATKARSTRGLTRANISLADLGIFGSGTLVGGPLTGLALLFGKKLLQAPSVRLRIAKYLDSVSDARKAAIIEDLKAGEIPPDFDQFIKR